MIKFDINDVLGLNGWNNEGQDNENNFGFNIKLITFCSSVEARSAIKITIRPKRRIRGLKD